MPVTVDHGIHHVAYACRDLEATNRFYTELMGFELVHTEVNEVEGGYFRHVFYDTGAGGMLAFFDVHGVGEAAEWDSAVSTGNGLPVWVNHIAFAADEARMEAARARMAGAGIEPLMELDHGWCHSLYFRDPNGIMVEFCRDTPGFERDPEQATAMLTAVPAGRSTR
jgi:catechol 2,3-dioxygenase-like lactoylglutathione lyase family enzyme